MAEPLRQDLLIVSLSGGGFEGRQEVGLACWVVSARFLMEESRTRDVQQPGHLGVSHPEKKKGKMSMATGTLDIVLQATEFSWPLFVSFVITLCIDGEQLLL